jgi:protein-tyrosine phosphatase
MKYGIAFTLLAALIAYIAIINGGSAYLLLWPALSFFLVAFAYFGAGPTVFGKQQCGTLEPSRQILLAPFLLYLWLVWHMVRLISREAPYNQLTESVFIGRRLLSSERPKQFDHVVDLTCEFNEPSAMRSTGYISFPTLDTHHPSIEELRRRVEIIANLDGTVYIHCAQGHGRTATLAIAYLLQTGHSATVDDAIRYVLDRRPLAHLGRSQRQILQALRMSGNNPMHPSGGSAVA